MSGLLGNVVEIAVRAKDETKAGMKSASGFGDKIAVAGKVATGALLGAGAAMVKFGDQAADLSETQSKVNQIFGADGAASLDKYAASAAQNLGQSKQTALDAAATFGVLGKSAGLAGDDLVGFSTDMNGLASDMASFNNTSPEEAIAAIGAGLRGESEPLRRFGVMLDDATLKAEAMKLGLIKTTTEALTPQQKILAAQQAILKQTGDQQGDFARTSEGLANKQKIAKAELANMTTELGERAVPIMSKAVDVGMSMIAWAEENSAAAKVLAAVIGALAAAVVVASVGMKVYAAGAAIVTGVTKGWTLATKALNFAMKMNPIGLVITAVAALVAIVIVIEKRTKFFSRVWGAAWKGIQRGASAVKNWLSENWPLLLAIITGPIGLAVLAIKEHKNSILGFFKALPEKIGEAFTGLAGVIKGPFELAFAAVKALWNSTVGGFGFTIPDWVPGVGGQSFHIPEMARGGIGGGLAMVGERGRELVRLPHGSTVYPNGTTEAMLAGGRGGGRFVLELRSSGSRVDDMLVELLRGAIRTRGGNVQVVLGRGSA